MRLPTPESLTATLYYSPRKFRFPDVPSARGFNDATNPIPRAPVELIVRGSHSPSRLLTESHDAVAPIGTTLDVRHRIGRDGERGRAAFRRRSPRSRWRARGAAGSPRRASPKAYGTNCCRLAIARMPRLHPARRSSPRRSACCRWHPRRTARRPRPWLRARKLVCGPGLSPWPAIVTEVKSPVRARVLHRRRRHGGCRATGLGCYRQRCGCQQRSGNTRAARYIRTRRQTAAVGIFHRSFVVRTAYPAPEGRAALRCQRDLTPGTCHCVAGDAGCGSRLPKSRTVILNQPIREVQFLGRAF